jgi:hypothetical protein
LRATTYMPQHFLLHHDDTANAKSDLTAPAVAGISLAHQLDEFLYECWLPGRWVQRIWILADLPPRLERRARSLSRDAIWRAYTDGTRLWFAIAAAAETSSPGPCAAAMKVLFYENDGALCSGGIWARDPIGEWRLERLVDMPSKARGDWDVPSAHVQLVHKGSHG